MIHGCLPGYSRTFSLDFQSPTKNHSKSTVHVNFCCDYWTFAVIIRLLDYLQSPPQYLLIFFDVFFSNSVMRRTVFLIFL